MVVRKSKYARRQGDRAYLAWIRSLPCLICGRRPSEAAHLGTRAFGQKCSDRETGPLCDWDHRLGPHSHHVLGKKFWNCHAINRAKLIRHLNERYETRNSSDLTRSIGTSLSGVTYQDQQTGKYSEMTLLAGLCARVRNGKHVW